MSSPQDDRGIDDTQTAHRNALGDDATQDALDRKVLRARVRNRLFDDDDGEAPKIGRYPVLERLGEGGMGRVYAVYDETLDRRVALKVLKGTNDDEHARGRMLREAQAMAKLSHPNVLPVFEVGEHEGQLFMTMELVRGRTLREWQADGERSWTEVLATYLQAARGLVAAHEAGLVHRDFKPQNVVIGGDGRVRVLDFGLARRDAIGGDEPTAEVAPLRPAPGRLDTPLTRTGTVVGTPAYMAPEQFVPGAVDHRADQFSFCVSLWEALYGRRPFAADSVSELLGKIARGRPDPPTSSAVPHAVLAALERGLQPAPDDRWPSLTELIASLERLVPPPASAQRIASGADGAWGALAALLVTFLVLLAVERSATALVNVIVLGVLMVPLGALVGLIARRRVAWAATKRGRAWWRVAGISWPWIALIVVVLALTTVLAQREVNAVAGALVVGVSVPAALWVLERVLPRPRSLLALVVVAALATAVLLSPFVLALVQLGAELRGAVLFVGSASCIVAGAAVSLARAPS